MEKPRIAFIGSGVMAEVMITGLVSRDMTAPERIWAAGPRQERADQLFTAYDVRGTTDPLEAVENADLIVLSVKPQTLAHALKQIKPRVPHPPLLIAAVAGPRLAPLGTALGPPSIRPL